VLKVLGAEVCLLACLLACLPACLSHCPPACLSVRWRLPSRACGLTMETTWAGETVLMSSHVPYCITQASAGNKQMH
jgi:hypothetical protein